MEAHLSIGLGSVMGFLRARVDVASNVLVLFGEGFSFVVPQVRREWAHQHSGKGVRADW